MDTWRWWFGRGSEPVEARDFVSKEGGSVGVVGSEPDEAVVGGGGRRRVGEAREVGRVEVEKEEVGGVGGACVGVGCVGGGGGGRVKKVKLVKAVRRRSGLDF